MNVQLVDELREVADWFRLLDTLRRAYEAGFSCGRRAYKAVCAASLEEKGQQR
jgi:hypothetical protein